MNLLVRIVSVSLLLAFNAYGESVDSVQSNRIASKSAANKSTFLGSAAQAYDLNIPEVKIDLNSSTLGMHKTGVVYQLPEVVKSSQLAWEPVNGDFVTRVRVNTIQAKRLRIHLIFEQTVPVISFRVQGNQDTSPIKQLDQRLIHDNNIWLPITKGNSADLEILVSTKKPPEINFSIDAINLIVASQVQSGTTNSAARFAPGILKAQSLGLAQESEYDLTCWDNIPQYSALQQAASATAKIEFIKKGSSFLCSGTLLNDTRSSLIPWFVTANHCLTDQTAANTASFEWFFQATSCGGFFTDSRDTQTFGGARLLKSSGKNDYSFLRLNVSPPAGVFHMGWDSNRVNKRSLGWGVHHPEGDHTMVSEGRVTDIDVKVKGQDDRTRLLNEVTYFYGGAEFGSSGSGLFTMGKGGAKWRGTLYGGPASDYRIEYYTDFSKFYSDLRPWLARKKRR